MIVVAIELWPHGDESKRKILGVCKIVNDGAGNNELRNYDVALSHSGRYMGRKGAWKTGKVTAHRASLSPYHLVHKAIKACLWPVKKGGK